MSQKIHTGIDKLLQEANANIVTTPVAQALGFVNNANVMMVDLRDPREREREGKVPGAFHCPRGMLEFWIDPASPYHKPEFAQDKHYVFFCAGGWRSALAAYTAHNMGLAPVSHIEGGFKAWREAGGAIEPLLPAKKP